MVCSALNGLLGAGTSSGAIAASFGFGVQGRS